MKRALRLLALLFACACEDPVHDQRVEDLGPEPGPYEQGPLHRAGQPCTVCHGGKGPGGPTFDLAGTVFASQSDRTGVVGAKVVVYDGKGSTQAFFTNAVGTFVAEEGDLTLEFPLWVAIEAGAERIRMETPIFRARSCAECHADPRNQHQVGHVYLRESP